MATDVSRRALLATLSATGAASMAGCFSRVRSQVAYTPAQQVDLTVSCVPADRDPIATGIARSVRDALDDVGADVGLELVSEEQLLRDALYNHQFDLLVTRVSGHREPDELRALLHSRFAEEEGWQNPGGYANANLDRTLERQRRAGAGNRRDSIEELQRTVAREVPFVPVAAPTHLGVVAAGLSVPGRYDRTDRFSYLLATREAESLDRLSLALTHTEPTVNRNLLAVEFRSRDGLVDLLYDPLVRRLEREYVPWLASDVAATDEGLRVELRPECTWHDGTDLTAEDVAFTYRFLQDTALGSTDSPVPAPRYRSQTSLVESVTASDEHTLTFEFATVRRAVASHALTVPILPEHEWRARSELQRAYLTAALLGDVDAPVGSGPLAFESASTETSLTFRRFDDHFLRRDDDLPAALEAFRGGPEYEELEARYVPNVSAAVNGVGTGEFDAIDGSVPPGVAQVAMEHEDVTLVERPSADYYAVWFDVRSAPLSHHGFRAAVARLLDRDAIVATAFDGYGTPTETPLHASPYVPDDLEWDGSSVLGAYPGADGDLDVEAARQLFREAGFRYHEGALLARQ